MKVTQADGTEENGKDESVQEESKDASNDKKAAKRNPFVTTNITKLGKIEQIETDNPIMKVPFEDGCSLVFQGKEVETSSKFMMVNCKVKSS